MVVTGDDGVSRLTFDAYRSGMAELAVIVENSVLQAALRRALEQRDLVSTLQGRRCEAVRWRNEAVAIGLDDGQQIEAQLVVAADGANSRVRELAGIPVSESAYGHSAVVAQPGSGSGPMAYWRCCRCPASGCRWCGQRSRRTPTS